MCAKPEPSEYYRPINDLLLEFSQYEQHLGITIRDLPWVGITAYNALLENV